MCVSTTARSTFRGDDGVTDIGEVLDHKALGAVHNQGPRGDLNNNVQSIAAAAIRAGAMLPTLCYPLSFVLQSDKAIDAIMSLNNHASPISAITSIRPPFGNVSFPTETHASIATFSRGNFDFDSVDKHIQFVKKLIGADGIWKTKFIKPLHNILPPKSMLL